MTPSTCLARALGRQRSVVHDVVTGRRNIGLRLGKDLAKAFDMPADEFFKRLGIFRVPSENPKVAELAYLAEIMSDAALDDVLAFAHHRKQLGEKRGEIAQSKQSP